MFSALAFPRTIPLAAFCAAVRASNVFLTSFIRKKLDPQDVFPADFPVCEVGRRIKEGKIPIAFASFKRYFFSFQTSKGRWSPFSGEIPNPSDCQGGRENFLHGTIPLPFSLLLSLRTTPFPIKVLKI